MQITFPDGFLWGTSTSAAQIETASDHNFRGLEARDGHLLERTTDHERRRLEDVDAIARFGSVYRCSVDWAGLQKEAYASFDKAVVSGYREFFEALNARGVKILFVLHHFAHPAWFEREGGWTWESNQQVFYDYAARCMDAFGDLVYAWNTFNEPNVYALNGFYLGHWPPYVQSLTKASRVLGNMAQAHEHIYHKLKARFPSAQVGYSLNTVFAEGRGLSGQTSARFFDWWFYSRPVKLFSPVDFTGVGYYAYLVFAPEAISAVTHADRLEQMGIPHDRMWALKPEGLAYNIRRVHKDTGKPVWIMENGTCTDDSGQRIATLTDYLRVLYGVLREGLPVLGYNLWAPWDNFEWNLGPTYRFGLLRTDYSTMERQNTPAADWYEEVVRSNAVEV